MWRISVVVGVVFAVQLGAPAYAILGPATKDMCDKMVGTVWDEAQGKCVWNPLVKEGCEQLAGVVWDQAQGKCVQKEPK